MRKRLSLTVVFSLVATGVAVAVGATPAAADSYGGYATANLNIRSGPSTTATIIGSLPVNSQVHVYCVRGGTTVNGNSIWDNIGNGGYVADAYVYTGTDEPIAQGCGALGPGSVENSVVPGCSFAGSYANSNYDVVRSPEVDWFQQSGTGCSNSIGMYYFTYGNGPSPSGDYVRWDYWPGAYAHCNLAVGIPPRSSHTFDTSAHYQVVTGSNRATVVRDIYVDQNGSAGSDQYLFGSFSADGSGYLGVKLLDSSQSGSAIRVVAALLHYTNCVTAAG